MSTTPDQIKKASTSHPVEELIRKRWSPYGYEEKDVSTEDLLSLFEAARWAPSSYNEQPWRYIVARREEPELFQKVLSCLVEQNQAWAKNAPVLVLTVASLHFARNQKPNRHAWHDVGLASACLTFEATSRGLAVHQMAGILPDKAREVFGIPKGYEAVTGMAIGYAVDDASRLDEDLRDRDTTPRSRRPLKESVFGGTWDKSSPFVS